MPQLDPTTFSPQLIWLAITFVVLYVVMARFALPRISQVLEHRQNRLDDLLDKAEALRAEAVENERDYDEAMGKAREQARATIQAANREMTEDSAERHAELGQALAARIREAEARINQAKQDAIAGVRDTAASVAISATERLVGVRPAEDAARAAIDRAMERRA